MGLAEVNDLNPISSPRDERDGAYPPQVVVDPALLPYQTVNQINLESIRGIAWRQRWLLGITIAAALVLGFVATLLMTPMYTAVASARVDPEVGSIVPGQEVQSADVATNEISRYLTTLAAVVQSQAMALRVVDLLGLDTVDPLSGEEAERPAGLSDAQWRAVRRDRAASAIRGGVETEVPVEERIVEIRYRSPDPRAAGRIANAYLDAFLVDDVRRGLEKSEYAQKYLQQEIIKVRGEVQAAEREALAYARANGIISPAMMGTTEGEDTVAPQTIIASTLAATNEAYTSARAARIAAQERWRTVAATPATQLAEVQGNGAYQSLVGERAKAAADLADLRTRYGAQHPQVVELTAQIASLDRQIASIASNIKAVLRKDYETAQRRESALSGELAQVSGRTLDEQDKRVQFNQLDREAMALRAQLQTLLERYNQVASAANVRTGTVTKLDEARVPSSPSSPDLIKNMLIALVLGVAAAGGLAMLRELLDDRLRSADDVERKLGLALLGVTPSIEEGEATLENRALDEAYASIRTALDFAMPNRTHNVIQVTSSQSGEGKSTTAIALAEQNARLGRRVLLVDGDLRKPSIGKSLGVARGSKGVAEVLLGTVPFHDALLRQTKPNLDVLPVGELPSNPVDVLSSQHLTNFIDTYRQQYDLIVIDAPPVVGLADSPILSRIVDGTVFIVESNRAHFGAVKTAMRRLKASNAHLLGVVLTKFVALDAGQSYDYHYSYYAYGDDSRKAT